MKRCEFDGWMEVESFDILMAGDVWKYIEDKYLDEEETINLKHVDGIQTLGELFLRPGFDEASKTYRLFRKYPDAKKIFKLKSKPLPLP